MPGRLAADDVSCVIHERSMRGDAPTVNDDASNALPRTRRRRRSAGLLLVAIVTTALLSPVTVAAADNLPPVAVDDPGTTCQPAGAFGGAFPIAEDWGRFDFVGQCSAIANDTDADGTIVAWQIVSQPAHGRLEYLPNFPGIFGYTPDPDFSTPAGDWVSDSFTYRVVDNLAAVSNIATMRFWVAPINDAPEFLSVPNPTVDENSGPYDVSWLPFVSPGPTNESAQSIAFVITQVESHGVVDLFSERPTFTPDGRLTFTPGPDEHGYATVTVYLRDNGGLERYGLPNLPDPPDDTSDPVTFTIFVNDVNATPVAQDDVAAVAEDSGANRIEVLANDSDADAETIWVVDTTDGSKGTVDMIGDGAAVSYTPAADATGSDAFTYTIRDQSGATDTATVFVTITPINDPPTAVDDGMPTPIQISRGSGPVSIDVLANDSSFPDGSEVLQITAVTQGAIGSVAVGAGGVSLTYDPAGQKTGPDTFTYTISDGHGGFDTGTVQVEVIKVKPPR